MGSGDLSTDLALGILLPASPIRPSAGGSDHEETAAKTRRRTRASEQTLEDGLSADPADAPVHELDRLA